MSINTENKVQQPAKTATSVEQAQTSNLDGEKISGRQHGAVRPVTAAMAGALELLKSVVEAHGESRIPRALRLDARAVNGMAPGTALA